MEECVHSSKGLSSWKATRYRVGKGVILFGLGTGILLAGWAIMIKMPGNSYQGPMPPATDELRAMEQELQAHVYTLGGEIGERNVFHYDKLIISAEYIRAEFRKLGYKVNHQAYEVFGKICENIEVEVRGTDRADEILVIGAHYDSVQGSPGANDNGTGVAALLVLARAFVQTPMSRTMKFVAFVNEEPPFFQTQDMGSWVYAKRSRRQGENIILMLSLETIGYYTHEPQSQRYPPPLSLIYPSTGNFLAFVSNIGNGSWVRKAIGIFRGHASFPSEGAALWGGMPGVGWSDHWAFWEEGYPAIMVTDTAPYRDPYYHTAHDTPDHIDYESLARVVSGLHRAIADIANEPKMGN